MIAVIFEFTPGPERRQEYLDLAARLRPQLEAIDGFLSIERFTSMTTEGKLLSLSGSSCRVSLVTEGYHMGLSPAPCMSRVP